MTMEPMLQDLLGLLVTNVFCNHPVILAYFGSDFSPSFVCNSVSN